MEHNGKQDSGKERFFMLPGGENVSAEGETVPFGSEAVKVKGETVLPGGENVPVKGETVTAEGQRRLRVPDGNSSVCGAGQKCVLADSAGLGNALGRWAGR